MESIELLQRELVLLLANWLGPERSERMRRIQSIADVGEWGHSLLVMVAEDQVLFLGVHRMPSRFLPPGQAQKAPGSIGIPVYRFVPG